MFPETSIPEQEPVDLDVEEIDLDALAEKLAELLLKELAIEKERTGR